MNIFLDTNIVYKDPFLQRGKLIILRELAKSEDVTVYINKAVLSETRRGYREYIQDHLIGFQRASSHLNKYISNVEDSLTTSLNLDYFLKEFDTNIEELEAENIIVITPYYAEVVDEIVNMDMYKLAPFYNKINGKKSVRDAIIWYSYKRYICEKQLENCYFLSHNTTDFAQHHKEAQLKESFQYELNKALGENPYRSTHKSCGDFINTYEDQIQAIFVENDIDILTPHRIQKIERLFMEQNIISEIDEFICAQVEEVVNDDIMELGPPHDITGYVESDGYMGTKREEIQIRNFSSYGSRILLDVSLTYEKEVEVFMYNPVRDSGEDRHTCIGNEELTYEVNCTITWEVTNHIQALSSDNFKISQIVELLGPEDITVKIISRRYGENLTEPPEFDDGLDLRY
jgi:hypothetical protein